MAAGGPAGAGGTGAGAAGPARRAWWDVDRRWIFLLVGLGTLLPLIFPIGLLVSPTAPVKALFDKIESLQAGDIVMISFDYGAASAPENDPMAAAVLRHCFARKIRVVGIALYPVGGLTQLNLVLENVAREMHVTDGVDYVNLGYKDGGQAAMKQMGVAMAAVFPVDGQGRAVGEIPLMREVRNYRDINLVFSIATGIIGEWWANLVNAQFGIPVAVGCTAVSAPKYYAYYRAGQMIGLLGGLKGASEYEKLLTDAYPQFRPVYETPGVYTATKGMDVQSIVHVIIIAFIVLGNVIYFRSRRQAKRERRGMA